MNELFDIENLHLKGFIEREYKGFLDGEKGKGCKSEVFKIFCEVLDIPWWSLLPEDSPEYKLHNKNHVLLNELKSYDYEDEVKKVNIELFKNHVNRKVFRANKECSCRLTWMLRRLENNIYEETNFKCRVLSKKRPSYLPAEKNYENTFREVNLEDLTNHNILIVLEIESYEDVEKIIDNWQSLRSNISNESAGKLVMFLKEERQSSYPEHLRNHLIELKPTEEKLTEEWIVGLISAIGVKLKKTVNDPQQEAQELNRKSQNNPLMLLKEIYQYFDVERDGNWQKLWTEYP